MKKIESHIQYLLTKHDCVIVPGWGALVVQHTCARIEGDTIIPPCRWLSFNAMLNHNDGMLAHSIMQAEQCSYDVAMARINNQVAQWHEMLQQKGCVQWEGIGEYMTQPNTTMLFVESADSVVQAPLSVLPSISMMTLSQMAVAERTPYVADEDEEKPQGHIQWHQRVWHVAASVAAVIIFMLLVVTPPVDYNQPANDRASLISADLLVQTQEATNEHIVVACEETEEVMVVEENVVAETVLESHVEADIVAEVAPVKAAEVQRHVVADSDYLPRYILVIGSLSSYELAQQQIQQFHNEGITDAINVYESNGKYRLYIEGYDSIQQAQKRVDEMMAQPQRGILGVWICSTR